MRSTLLAITVVVVSFLARDASAQFTTILNIPPDPDIGNDQGIGSDTQLNLFDGGTIGVRFDAGALDGTSTNIEVNISGGLVGDGFRAFDGSTVNISGGGVGIDFDANSGSEVNLFGTQFVLDSIDITASLTLNVPFTITDRDVTLEGVLADGLPFSFDLNSTNVFGEEFFDLLATLTVTLILSGDYNNNGIVDAADYTVWRDNLGSMATLPNDPLGGMIGQAHYDQWKASFGMTAGSGSGSGATGSASALATVPEPSTAVLLIVPLAALVLLSHREHREDSPQRHRGHREDLTG